MPETNQRPNVLLIMTDQHRCDFMNCAGWDGVPTPSVDRIARSGVRFENAYGAYPVCVASRMAMLTGLHAHQTGAINNDDTLDWRYRTMAHHFGDSGYLTGLIGKMHFADAHNHGFEYYLSINDWLMYLGPQVQHYANEIASNPPNKNHFLRSVFDTGAGFPDVYDLWDRKGSPWAGNVQQYDFHSMASDIPAEDHLDMFVARESAKFLRRYRDQPFFLCASFMKPHTPLFPPREWAEQYPVEDMELTEPDDISSYPEHIQKRICNTLNLDPLLRKAARAGYLGNLAFADHCVGVLLDAFEEQGLAENTIVVYTADHGDMHLQNGLVGKFCLFDPSVKVPLIVSYPKALSQDVVCSALVEQLGLYPTLADLTDTGPVGAPALRPMPDAPEQIAGQSFAASVRDPELPGLDAVFSEYNLRSANCQYMLRTDRYKYIHNDGSTDELYDLQQDPGETRNRITDPALQAIACELRDRLFTRFDPADNPFRAQPL
ncbi:MAG: sulfatase-like hydrolase/transferase [Victivallales bacterium]|jgi:arylsulfatase A-like enzyme|nr:sulfatase-like hydrolase/transferase [Victivallales bacterium]